jgi:hypothetical protein
MVADLASLVSCQRFVQFSTRLLRGLRGQGLITSSAGLTFLMSVPTWWDTEYGLLCVKELLDPSQ